MGFGGRNYARGVHESVPAASMRAWALRLSASLTHNLFFSKGNSHAQSPQPVADTVQFALADPSYLQGVCVHLWPVVPAVAAINETHADAAAAAPDLISENDASPGAVNYWCPDTARHARHCSTLPSQAAAHGVCIYNN